MNVNIYIFKLDHISVHVPQRVDIFITKNSILGFNWRGMQRKMNNMGLTSGSLGNVKYLQNPYVENC